MLVRLPVTAGFLTGQVKFYYLFSVGQISFWNNLVVHGTSELLYGQVDYLSAAQVDHLINFEPCWWSFHCGFSAAVEIDCPSGTYAMGQNTTCTKCPAGKKCPNVDGSSIDDCQPGQFSLAGMATFDPFLGVCMF